MKPEILVLSSGGSKGLAHFGALAYHEKSNNLTNIHTYVGCSIGSLCCLLLNIGYKPSELAEIFLEFKLDYQVGLSNIIDDYGFYELKPLNQKISKLIQDKLNIIPTFQELYELTKKRLIVTTYNVDKSETYYFDYFTEPDFSVVDAVCISMSIPIFFKSTIYKGYRFVDGAVGDPFSIDIINDGSTPILGIVLYSEKRPVKSFINYVWRLSDGNNREYIQMKLKNLDKNCSIVEVDCIDPDFFTVNYEERMEVYSLGWKFAQEKDLPVKREDNLIIEKINEICSPPFLSILAHMMEHNPDAVIKGFTNLPYYQVMNLCKISDMFKEIKILKQVENVKQIKNTIYHHLHRIMSIVIPKHFWSKIPLIKEKV